MYDAKMTNKLNERIVKFRKAIDKIRPPFEGKVDPKTHCVSCGHRWPRHKKVTVQEPGVMYRESKCTRCFCHSEPNHIWYICNNCKKSDMCWSTCDHCGSNICEDCEYIDGVKNKEMWWVCPVCKKDYHHIDTNPKHMVEIKLPKKDVKQKWKIMATKQVKDTLDEL